jgi:hypothetical protein
MTFGWRSHAMVFFCLCVLPFGVQCNEEPSKLRGSGVGSRVARTVTPFERLEVGGRIRVEVEVGKPLALELLGDDNLLSRVATRARESTLVIEPDTVLAPTQPLVARVTTPALAGITLLASSSAIVNGVTGERFSASGTGATRLTLSGSATHLEVATKTAARMDLTGLTASSAEVVASGGSHVVLGHLEKLDVTQTGPSVVFYRGEPELVRHVTQPARLLRAR